MCQILHVEGFCIFEVQLHLSLFQQLQVSNGLHRSSLHSDNCWSGSYPDKDFLGGNHKRTFERGFQGGNQERRFERGLQNGNQERRFKQGLQNGKNITHQRQISTVVIHKLNLFHLVCIFLLVDFDRSHLSLRQL